MKRERNVLSVRRGKRVPSPVEITTMEREEIKRGSPGTELSQAVRAFGVNASNSGFLCPFVTP